VNYLYYNKANYLLPFREKNRNALAVVGGILGAIGMLEYYGNVFFVQGL
jgi:hypothetical protein